MILCDQPRWPAHGKLFGHLVSDESLLELHLFAAQLPHSWRAFDHDHYDLPEDLLPTALANGATLVSERELLSRLTSAGLRVRQPDKLPHRSTVLPMLRKAWNGLGLGPAGASAGAELLTRWQEPHRHYHDVRHLWQVLTALDHLTQDPGAPLTVRLAAWFHDAVYAGVAGQDERDSAALAHLLLDGVLPTADVAEVARLVGVTTDHSPPPDDLSGCLLSDADLAVLGQTPGRYDVYVRDVRTDYAHVDDATWAVGRVEVLDHLLELRPLFRTPRGRDLWSGQATQNLAAERRRWAEGSTAR